MKKKFALLLACIMTLAVFVPVNAMSNDIKIQLNGDFLTSDVSPIIENGRTLVPMRTVFEKMGANVEWDGINKVVKIEDQYTIIQLTIDQDTALVYRKYDLTGIPEKIKLEAPAKVVKGRTLVPVRFVVETLQSTVIWDAPSRTVVISTIKPNLRQEKQLKFEVVDFSTINNKELEAWYRAVSESEGFCFKTFEGVTYIKAAAGMKPSGGYSIDVNSLYDLGNGKLYVEALVTEPGPDDMVTLAITYPQTIIRITSPVTVKELTGLITRRPNTETNPVEANITFELVNHQTIKLPALNNLVEKHKTNSGFHYIKHENTIYVLIAAGAQPTSGYDILVDSVTQVAPDSVYINAQLISPDPELMTLQVITYPYVVIKFDGTTIKDLQGSLIGSKPNFSLR